MKRQTIGKIQIILGILIIILLILSFIIVYPKYKLAMENGSERYSENVERTFESDKISNETKIMSSLIYTNIYSGYMGLLISNAVILVASGVMLFLLSIMMILQGLVNISEKK